MEGDREVGPDHRVRDLAARQVHRCRGVHGDDRHPGLAGATDELDGRADRIAQLPADAGPEQGVDDDRDPLDALAEDAKVARRPGRGSG